MFTFKIKFLLVLIVLWRLLNIFTLCIPTMLIVLFARKTNHKTTHHQQPQVQRYVLPSWLKWAESPDEHLPGGLYEPTVLKIYERFGWYWTSVYWIGLRNVGNGIVWNQGKPVPMALKNMTPEHLITYGLWNKKKYFLGLKIMYGWETVRDWYSTKTKDGFWAVPRFTIRLKNQT